jgi:gas vesicle protein
MRSGAFWTGVLIGAAVGAAAGMICAPKAGEETRGEVAAGVRKLKDFAADRGRRLWACCHRKAEDYDESQVVGYA